MTTFTGNKDIDMSIINRLNDQDLALVCQVNKYVNSFCKSDIFWMNRVKAKMSPYIGSLEEIREKYLGDDDWETYYKDLTNAVNGNIEDETYVIDLEETENEYLEREGYLDRDDFEVLREIRAENTDKLRNAAENNNLSQVIQMVENETFLEPSVAFVSSNIDIIKYLLDRRKIDSRIWINYFDEDLGKTVLNYHAEKGNTKIVQLLLQNGAYASYFIAEYPEYAKYVDYTIIDPVLLVRAINAKVVYLDKENLVKVYKYMAELLSNDKK